MDNKKTNKQLTEEQEIKNKVIVVLEYDDLKSGKQEEFNIKIKNMLGKITSKNELEITLPRNEKEMTDIVKGLSLNKKISNVKLKNVKTLEHLKNSFGNEVKVYLERTYYFKNKNIFIPFNLGGILKICCEIDNTKIKLINTENLEMIPDMWKNGF